MLIGILEKNAHGRRRESEGGELRKKNTRAEMLGEVRGVVESSVRPRASFEARGWYESGTRCSEGHPSLPVDRAPPRRIPERSRASSRRTLMILRGSEPAADAMVSCGSFRSPFK